MATVALLVTAVPARPAAADHDDTTRVDSVVASRRGDRWQVSGCVHHAAGPVDAGATVRVLVDGQEVPGLHPALVRHLPHIDSYWPRTACPREIAANTIPFELTLAQVAAAGVAVPEPGGWTSFVVTVELTASGTTSSASRVVDQGAGPLVASVTGVTTAWDGMRVQGEVVDPQRSDASRFVVLVDGVLHGLGHVPFATTSDPDDRWLDRELGADHRIDALVPYGSEACVVLVDRVEGEWVPTLLAGCVAGHRGWPSGRIESVTGGPGSVTVSGWVFDPTLPYPDDAEAPNVFHHRNNAHLRVDGRTVDVVFGDVWRDDVLPGPGHNGRSGYTTTAVVHQPGWHEVCIVHRAEHRPRIVVPPPVEVVLDCARVLVRPAQNVFAQGSVEQLVAVPGGVAVRGWAIDRDGGRPRGLIAVNGLPVRVFQPALSRPDVHAVHGGDPTSGFDEHVALPPGGHRVCVAFEDVQGWRTWSPDPPMCASVVVK